MEYDFRDGSRYVCLIFLLFFSVIGGDLELYSEPAAPKNLFVLSGQSNMENLDVDKYFAPVVEKRFGENKVSIVKAAKGSEPISSWYDAHSEDRPESKKSLGELYLKSVGQIKEISGNTEFRSVTFLWMQGERDAYKSKGPYYEANLKGLLGELSKDTGCSNINVVIGRLSDFGTGKKEYPHWSVIRRIHEKVASERANIVWVDTDDLNDFHTGSAASPVDRLHYTEDGYKLLGRRFANESIRLLEKFDCSSA
ncbi:sialate O-acetylesterase [Marinobacter sp. DUT-3]|uniref:sialate O-acetylesterase n=1 Tax=Marinobacter sp. DUT-3 TaxID=3412036 RepID=UPI003D16AF59